MTSSRGYLGLVELYGYEHLVENYGELSANHHREEFCARVLAWTRSSDQTRKIGENRFLVLLKGVSAQIELDLAAAKLERIFKEPYDDYGQQVPFNIHAGFALLEQNSKDIKKAQKRSHIALREAAQKQILYKIFDPNEYKQVKSENKLLLDLERAVEQGEFHLYYQPKIHCGFGNIIGAEALIRWHKKDNKVIPPSQFIELAERHISIIRPMTWWILKTAISQLSRWPETLSISVNVPPPLLLNDDITRVVSDMLEIQDIKPSRLIIEVTENIMVSDQQKMLARLAELRTLGVRISIDDFGTGYSSLSYFRNLPADELKIDRCFVSRMLKSEKDQAIVKTVIDLAHNFSLKVVAEGVEDAETAKRLKEMKCDVIQGFFYDRPLPLKAFEEKYL